jgi:hypothetical protein
MNIQIESISIDDVNTYDKEKYNSNNHWVGNNVSDRPVDYKDVLEKCETYYWIDKFRDRYSVINIDQKELLWMKDASVIGKQSGKFSCIYDEDLDDFIKRNEHLTKMFNTGEKYFIRTDNVSLKYGMHRTGPYDNLKNVMQSLVTSTSGHSPVNSDTTKLKLYVLPWMTINDDMEFRVFVCKNKITAISQQHLYQTNKFLKTMSEDDKIINIHQWINSIVTYFENVVSKKITHIDSYVMDIALLSNNEPYFIEINSWGKEYASGSSLFHWLINENILYDIDKANIIYFRYVT